MEVINFTPLTSLAGGLLIGTAAALLMFFNGKISGISGISKGIINKDCPTPQERRWRISFVLGLIIGGILVSLIFPQFTGKIVEQPPIKMIIAGLLVGYGTSLGNGCTSGHGVCGLGRKSVRSLASVITFMTSGFVTVYILFHVFNLGV